MYRFFENTSLKNKNIFILNDNNSHKIINVLKLQVNQEIYLFNNTNYEFLSKIIRISLKQKIVQVEILNMIHRNLESKLQIHLVQSIAKNDNMDLVIQKSTELGVTEITPIISERTIVKPKNYEHRLKHWETIAIGACCQCGRNLIPYISPILTFKDFINNTQKLMHKEQLQLILSPSLRIKNISDLFNNENCKYKKICIVIGPEGGFTIEELDIARQNQFLAISLGSRILRTETASIAMISILQATFGDLFNNEY